MTLVLAKKMQPHSADFRFKSVIGRRIRWKSALRSRILFKSTKVMHRPRSNFPLHFDIENIYHKFVRKNKMLAPGVFPATLLERWPQVCRIKIRFLPTNLFVSTRTNSMKCFVNWISANSHVRLNKTQPYRGYRDSVFATVREAITIWCQGVPS